MNLILLHEVVLHRIALYSSEALLQILTTTPFAELGMMASLPLAKMLRLIAALAGELVFPVSPSSFLLQNDVGSAVLIIRLILIVERLVCCIVIFNHMKFQKVVLVVLLILLISCSRATFSSWRLAR